MELTAYSVKLRKKVQIANPEIVTMKNGRKADRELRLKIHHPRYLEYLVTRK